MKCNKGVRRAVVSADGRGVVFHAGVGLLREMAELTGLSPGVTGALLDTYLGVPVHAPGRVFTDLACAIADGADCVSGIGTLVDRRDLFGPVESMPTTGRLLNRIDAAHLGRVRAGRAAGAGPLGLRGSDPPVHRGVCRARGGVLVRVPDRRPDPPGRGPDPRALLGPGHPDRRGPARRGVGVRSHRTAHLPCHATALNAAWLETVLTAVDLVTWTQLIGFTGQASLARCEIGAFRYRVLHVAARITRGARRTHLRIDQSWRWAIQIAAGFHRIRAAFA